jgi:phosphatidylglycerol---prolipoprotein diacylglyceryl transferase
MYPDLSYVFHDLFGTAADNWTSIFKVYGIFLVLAVLGAARIFYVELRRKSREGIFQPLREQVKEGGPATRNDYISAVLWGFLLGFKIPYIALHFAEFQADAAAMLFSLKGIWWAGIAGAAISAASKYWTTRRSVAVVKTVDLYPHDRIGEITVIAAVAGVIGAKVFSILEDPKPFFADPAGTLFSGAGLTIYGGLIFGFVAVWYYLRRKKIPVLPTMDAVAPALIISYGIGRLGCHFSGDGDWGIVAGAQPAWWFLPDWLWSMDYPRNIINSGVLMDDCVGQYCRRLAEPVFPTSIYEAVMALAIGGILWALRKRLRVPATLFFVYLIFNGLERFWIEKIRVNEQYEAVGLTQAELIATALFVIGVAGVVVLNWKKKA